MNRGIYSTASGMEATQRLMDIITNNLANASTNGFKRDGVSFANAMERQMALGGQVLGTIGTGATEQGPFTDFSPGAITVTHNPLDVAIASPNGLFAVQTAPGSIAYTRDGSFSLDANRQLVTKQGYPVLDEGMRPIQVAQGDVQISGDGNIVADGKNMGKIAVFDGKFEKLGNNLFTATSTTNPIQVELKPQAIESSNVNPVESMIQMITLNRSFELAQKSMIQQDDLTQRLTQSLQQ